jgi:hypothetical protein
MITFFKKSLKNQVTFFIYSVFTAGRVCVSNHTLPILNQQEAIRTDSPLFLNTNTFTIMAKKTAAPAKKAAAPAKKAALSTSGIKIQNFYEGESLRFAFVDLGICKNNSDLNRIPYHLCPSFTTYTYSFLSKLS